MSKKWNYQGLMVSIKFADLKRAKKLGFSEIVAYPPDVAIFDCKLAGDLRLAGFEVSDQFGNKKLAKLRNAYHARKDGLILGKQSDRKNEWMLDAAKDSI